MSGRFADNPFYVQYEALLRELHQLIAAGKGNDDEADTVRDRMDEPEQKLSQEEIMRLNGLSADLYMLQGDEVYDPYGGRQKELREALNSAYATQNFNELLLLLRRGPTFIPRYGIASLRATAYQELGHLETALVFLRHALSQTTGTNSTFAREWFQTQITSLLVRLERYGDAVVEVEASVDSLTFPDFRFISAHSLALCAEHMPPLIALSLYGRAAAVIESILNDPEERINLFQPLVSTAFQVLGDCYRNSGQQHKAEVAHNDSYMNSYKSVSSMVNDTRLRSRPQNQLDFLSFPIAA